MCLEGDYLGETPIPAPNAPPIFWEMPSLSTGEVSVTFVEMTVKVNLITFPNTQLTDSGQLIALLISTITLLGIMISTFKPYRMSDPRSQTAA